MTDSPSIYNLVESSISVLNFTSFGWTPAILLRVRVRDQRRGVRNLLAYERDQDGRTLHKTVLFLYINFIVSAYLLIFL